MESMIILVTKCSFFSNMITSMPYCLRTALHNTAFWGHLEHAGSDAKAIDIEGKTPYDIAVQRKEQRGLSHAFSEICISVTRSSGNWHLLFWL